MTADASSHVNLEGDERHMHALAPDLLSRYAAVPISMDHGRLEVGSERALTGAILKDISFTTGMRVKARLLDAETFSRHAIRFRDAQPIPQLGPAKTSANPAAEAGPGGEMLTGSIVHQIDTILSNALARGASDIHFEPYEAEFRVRFRIDGMLRPEARLDPKRREELISRLKIMATLDIAERRRPQDGRIRFTQHGTTVDVRVSTIPTEFGEKVVLRLLDKTSLRLELSHLGFDDAARIQFERAVRQPYGMVLVTGPTGSGKTSTLYAALQLINDPGRNITTIEDPIEYNLTGVNQTHVRADIGFTFASALRAFLRQDPDVIMVGEIRDAETAEIAIRAALTGHLVLSTLHTNDAASAVTRLVDMGIEPFLVASSLRLVVAQRLVRKICPSCAVAVDPLKGPSPEIPVGTTPGFHGTGCSACDGSGYRGRTGIFEVMPISEELSSLIVRRSDVHAVRAQATVDGVRTLREAALDKLREGVTTAEEVLRETLV